MVHFLWICPSFCEFSAHFNSFVNVDENKDSWVQKMGLHLGHILLQILLFCSWIGKGVSEEVLRGDKCQLLSGPFLKTHRALDLSPPFLSQTTTPLQFGGKTCQDCRCLWELDPSPPTTSISRYPFLENLEHLPLGHSTAHLHLGKALQRQVWQIMQIASTVSHLTLCRHLQLPINCQQGPTKVERRKGSLLSSLQLLNYLKWTGSNLLPTFPLPHEGI